MNTSLGRVKAAVTEEAAAATLYQGCKVVRFAAWRVSDESKASHTGQRHLK